MLAKFIAFATLAVTALGQNAAWSQCGGQNWKGSTKCIAGYTCKSQNSYYSQCVPGGQGKLTLAISLGLSLTDQFPVITTTTQRTSSTKAPASTRTSQSSSGPSNGVSYKASFTQYGAGDTFGSPNCQTKTAACFFYTQPGFSAAVSENLYGVGPVRMFIVTKI